MEKKLTSVIDKALSRRSFLVGAGTITAATVIAGCDSSTPAPTTPTPPPTPSDNPDIDILNFALNLEYLEAEYYLYAVTGSGLSAADAGSGAGTTVGGSKITFTNDSYAQLANLLAQDELNHVRDLRAAIAAAGYTPVPRPNLDYTAGFSAVGTASGIGADLSGFAGDTGLLLAAFTFEDVGVTAYTGAAPLISSSAILNTAAGFQSVEAYHAGIIRTIIAGAAAQPGADQTVLTNANKISALRATLGGGFETTLSTSSVVAADMNAIAYGRSTDEVLHILYGAAPGAGVKSGAFFPNGLNGTISVTAA